MKEINLRNNKKFSFIKIIGICILLLAVTAVIQWNTKETSATSVPDHLYALSVSTGVADGSSIGIFSVEYKDTQGRTRTEMVFPHDGDFIKSCELVAGYGTDSAAKKSLTDQGYYIESADLEKPDEMKALDINSENVYFIQLDHDVKSIENISIYTDYASTNSKNWSCTGLRFYKVSAIGGYRYYSGTGGTAYVDFAGTLMARMKNDRQEFNSANDTAFVLEPGSSQYPLLTSGFGEADRKLADDDSYIFKLDLADYYGAGVERFSNGTGTKTLSTMYLPEIANFTLTYKDAFGSSRTVDIPIVLNSISYALDQLGTDPKVAHFAGQGDSLMFSVKLPHMETIEAVKLSYGTKYVKEIIGLKDLKAFRERNVTANYIEDENDTMGLESLMIYKESVAGASVSLENNAVIVPSIDESARPEYYYLSSSADGLKVAIGKSANLELREYQEGAKLSNINTDQKYLIVIDTEKKATAASAAHVPSIEMKLTYQTIEGTLRETEEYDLEGYANDYYGFVPNTVNEDCSYAMNVRAGGKLYVAISLNDVEKFTGATFKMTDRNDEWQMSGFSIYMIDSMSGRKATWLGEELSFFGQSAVVGYYREINGSKALSDGDRLFHMNQKVFLHNGESKTIEFDSQSITEATKREDWTKEHYYTMDYSTAVSDLGFYVADMYYQVAVKVADNSNASVDDGDSGSKNFFYFQLLFANGKESAVVQANQQLEADGFLTGRIATFNIASNRDYGELEAIRIIPDDISEAADPYDKLNIENITVTKQAGNGYSRVWTIDNVGWIGPEYKDDGEANAAEDVAVGRTMEEMAKTFAVTRSESGVQLQFAITTGNYGKADGTNQRQFVGSVSAEISYIDNNGVYQTTNGIDVVEYMYYYAEKTPSAKTSKGLRQSDSGFMFLENTTNRFTVNINNIKKIEDIRLYVSSDVESILNIVSVSCSLVMKDGYLAINKWGEYEKTSEIAAITSNADVIPPFEVSERGTVEYVVEFIDTDENMIQGLAEGTWAYTIPAESISKYDYVNAFVYPTDRSSGEKDVDLKLSITYADSYGKSYVVTRNLDVEENDEGYYYSSVKLGTARLNAVKEVKIIKSGGSADEKLDYMILQRVRGDSMLQTERYDFSGKMASAEPTGSYAGIMQESFDQQILTLSFNENMNNAVLNRENKDLAVALRYTSTNDPSGIEYLSPYLYLTDAGYQNLAGGNTIKLSFNIPYLSEVTGISVAATGGLSAAVGKGYVATYRGTEEEQVLNGWYSILANTIVSNQSKEFGVATNAAYEEATVVPVRISLATGTEIGQNAGANGTISMEMNYIGCDGNLYTKVIDDLSNYLVSGNFQSGSTAEILILEENVQEISSFVFDISGTGTSSGSSKASWKIESVAVDYGIDEEQYRQSASVLVDDYIYEGEPKRVNLKNIILDVFYEENGRFVSAGKASQNGLIRETGEDVVFRYEVFNSNEGAEARIYEVSGISRREVTDRFLSEQSSSASEGEYIFCVPEGAISSEKEYVIEVSSVENSDVKVSFTVLVEPSAVTTQPEEITTQAPAEETTTEASSQEAENGNE